MILLSLLACTEAPLAEPCNGHPELCDRAVDEVTFPTTHNAMSAEEYGWLGPNQATGITGQLEDGVRGFLLDVYDVDGEALLCHANCGIGSMPLAQGLGYFAAFLQDHPREVVVLLFESYVDAEMLTAELDAAGLDAWQHPVGEPWPTLGELIASDRRVLVFGQDADDGVMHFYGHGWDTDYAAETPEDLSCDVLRGSRDNPLFLLNHFLTDPLASPDLAEQVNHDPFLSERASTCEAEARDRVTLLAVDFYEIGDLFSAVDRLNGL